MYVQADKPHKAHLECDGADEMSKMCIAEIDAKLDDDNLGEAGKARPEAGRNRRVRR